MTERAKAAASLPFRARLHSSSAVCSCSDMASGADVIMVPAAFTLQTGKDHWEVLLRARAIETQTYVVAAAQTGTYMDGNEERATWGHSMIVDPWGRILVERATGDGHVSADIDPELPATLRSEFPALANRRLSADQLME